MGEQDDSVTIAPRPWHVWDRPRDGLVELRDANEQCIIACMFDETETKESFNTFRRNMHYIAMVMNEFGEYIDAHMVPACDEEVDSG